MVRVGAADAQKSVGRKRIMAMWPGLVLQDLRLNRHPAMTEETLAIQDSMYVLRALRTQTRASQRAQNPVSVDAAPSFLWRSPDPQEEARRRRENESQPTTVTWLEYFGDFRQRLMQHFHDYPNCRVVVLCFDKHQHVPLAKSVLHIQRDAEMEAPQDLAPMEIRLADRVPPNLNDYLSDRHYYRKYILRCLCMMLCHPDSALYLGRDLAPEQSVVLDGHCLLRDQVQLLCTGEPMPSPGQEEDENETKTQEKSEEESEEKKEEESSSKEEKSEEESEEKSEEKSEEEKEEEKNEDESSSKEAEEESSSSSSAKDDEVYEPVSSSEDDEEIGALDKEEEEDMSSVSNHALEQNMEDETPIQVYGRQALARRRSEWHNTMGEGDFSVFFYVRQVTQNYQAHGYARQPHVVLYSTDTDFMYLSLVYQWKCHYVWHCTVPDLYIHKRHMLSSHSLRNEWLRVADLCQTLHQYPALSACPEDRRVLTFVVCMVAAGGDFVEKHWGVDPDDFMHAALHHMRHVRPLLHELVLQDSDDDAVDMQDVLETCVLNEPAYQQLLMAAHWFACEPNRVQKQLRALKREQVVSVSEGGVREQCRRETLARLNQAERPLRYQDVAPLMSPPRRALPTSHDMSLSCRQLCYYVRLMLCVGERSMPNYELEPFGYGLIDPDRGQCYKNLVRLINEPPPDDKDKDKKKRKSPSKKARNE